MNEEFLLAEVNNKNPLIENTILDTKYFDADYLFYKIVSFFNQIVNPPISSSVIDIFHGVIIFLAFFFIAIIFYTSIRMLEMRKKEHAYLKHELAHYAHIQAEKEKKLKENNKISENEEWVKILTYLFSENPSDWKLAVLEADAMLDQLMGQLGFKGENLGDKLKSADQERFKYLTDAWKVHNIRNRIAHEGPSFEFSQHEAKNTIAIYEQIFHEFGFI